MQRVIYLNTMERGKERIGAARRIKKASLLMSLFRTPSFFSLIESDKKELSTLASRKTNWRIIAMVEDKRKEISMISLTLDLLSIVLATSAEGLFSAMLKLSV